MCVWGGGGGGRGGEGGGSGSSPNTFSPTGTNSCDAFFPRSLSNDVFPSTTFLTSGQDASCVFHQPRQNRWFVAEWFICAAVNVTYDGF